MRYALATLMVLHGLGHLPGFLIPWGLVESPAVAARTMLIESAFGAGPTVLKGLGLVWLVLGSAFAVAAYGLAQGAAWWRPVTIKVGAASLIFCIFYLPDTAVGLLVNALLLTYLVLAERTSWMPGVVD